MTLGAVVGTDVFRISHKVSCDPSLLYDDAAYFSLRARDEQHGFSLRPVQCRTDVQSPIGQQACDFFATHFAAETCKGAADDNRNAAAWSVGRS